MVSTPGSTPDTASAAVFHLSMVDLAKDLVLLMAEPPHPLADESLLQHVEEFLLCHEAYERLAHDPVAQLRFLHALLRLATTAQTWEELLGTVVDGTKAAMRAEVSSLYLLDRDGLSLTLAATNGLDRHHIGHAKVPFGEGITGRVASGARRPPASTTKSSALSVTVAVAAIRKPQPKPICSEMDSSSR